MKLLLSALLLLTYSLSFANTNDCLNDSKRWIYGNTPLNSSESAYLALRFCGRSGDVDCLSEAKSWIYSNTPLDSPKSALRAVKFCQGGSTSCLSPTKRWIYSNTSKNSSESAMAALDACRTKNRCQ